MNSHDDSRRTGVESCGNPVSFHVEMAVAATGSIARFTCRGDQSLLAAMIAAGQRTLAIGCRSGGCGVCRVRILSGEYRTGHMTRAVISPADEAAGIVLSCRTYPASDICAEPMPLTPTKGQPLMERAA